MSDLELRERVAVEVMGVPDGSVFAPDDPEARAHFWRGARRAIANGPAYETDIAAAWTVVEKMRELGHRLVLCDHGGKWMANAPAYPEPQGPYEWPEGGLGDTAPEAICRAALSVVRGEA